MRIALGCDHRGLKLKRAIVGLLEELGCSYHDFGCRDAESVDYPDIARDVAKAVASPDFDQGILICSTGIGMSIAANKIQGIRAALCHNTLTAQRARQHNDANILCLGGDDVEVEAALEITKAYLDTDFEDGRHTSRVNKIAALEASPPQN